MQEVIDILFYTLGKFWDFIFNSYIIEGVSLGMLLMCSIIFSMLIRFVVAVPKAIPRRRRSFYDVYTQDSDAMARTRHYY